MMNNSTLLYHVKNMLFLNFKRLNKNYLFAFMANHLIYYPTPISLTYAWSFGFFSRNVFAYSNVIWCVFWQCIILLILI